MNQTIVTMRDAQGATEVDLTQSEEKYLVIIHNDETREHRHKAFPTKDEAYIVYAKITRAIVVDSCSWEQKKAMLD